MNIWSKSARKKKEKKRKTIDEGSQYRCGRGSRGVQPPSTPQLPTNTQTYIKRCSKRLFFLSLLNRAYITLKLRSCCKKGVGMVLPSIYFFGPSDKLSLLFLVLTALLNKFNRISLTVRGGLWQFDL